MEAIQAEEPFLLMPELKCTSPWAVDIQDSDLQLVTNACNSIIDNNKRMNEVL